MLVESKHNVFAGPTRPVNPDRHEPHNRATDPHDFLFSVEQYSVSKLVQFTTFSVFATLLTT